MKVAKLKNGSEEVASLVTVTMMALDGLMKGNPMVLYELNEICKNSKHEIFGNRIEPILRDLKLMDENGKIHTSIKNIVLSAIAGEGLGLVLVNPIAD